jgi:leucyl aminopeptidase
MKYLFIFTFSFLASFSSLDVSSAKHKTKQPTQVNFSDTFQKTENLVLGVYLNGELGQYGLKLNQQTNDGLKHAISVTGFEAKAKTTQLITAPKGSDFNQILLVGLGDKSEKLSDRKLQELGGNSVQAAVKTFKSNFQMAFDLNSQDAAHIAYGAKLGSYYFDKYYTGEERIKHIKNIYFVTSDAKAAKAFFKEQLNPLANAIWYTRDISNEPANIIYPESFVKRWKKHLKGLDNIKITVFDEKDMLKKGMGAIYGVGRGSKRPPRMMVVEYSGGKKGDAPIVIVGKGITFDTGGISIKGSNNMWNMKFDMSGAASAIGTVHALAGRNAKVNVVGIAALAENMPGANAQRPGDVVTSMSGKTIQIRSTDAEGRLVLADGVYYGDVTYNPPLLIDLATLTGSASRALGKDYAAFFTRHDEYANQFIAMGKQTGEEVWHLPLNKNHFKAIENKVADVMNSGPTAPGASAGAAFIGTFIRETTPWVHLDIAGVAWNEKATDLKASPGSTSYGIQLLNGYIKEHFEKK